MKVKDYLTEVTISQVNKMAKRYGATFHKGDGYFYFNHPTKVLAPNSGVYVFKVNQLTLKQWENELKDMLKK